jgi:hypothetical protein
MFLLSNPGHHERNETMSLYFSSPALDAELAYRREILTASGRGTRNRKARWLRNRKRTR